MVTDKYSEGIVVKTLSVLMVNDVFCAQINGSDIDIMLMVSMAKQAVMFEIKKSFCFENGATDCYDISVSLIYGHYSISFRDFMQN